MFLVTFPSLPVFCEFLADLDSVSFEERVIPTFLTMLHRRDIKSQNTLITSHMNVKVSISSPKFPATHRNGLHMSCNAAKVYMRLTWTNAKLYPQKKPSSSISQLTVNKGEHGFVYELCKCYRDHR